MGKIKMSGNLPVVGNTVSTVIEEEGGGTPRLVAEMEVRGDAAKPMGLAVTAVPSVPVALGGSLAATATVEGGAATKPLRVTTPDGDALEAAVGLAGDVGVVVEGGAAGKPLRLTTPNGDPLEAAVTVQGNQGAAKEIGIGPLRIRLEKTRLVPDLTLDLTLLGTPLATLRIRGKLDIQSTA